MTFQTQQFQPQKTAAPHQFSVSEPPLMGLFSSTQTTGLCTASHILSATEGGIWVNLSCPPTMALIQRSSTNFSTESILILTKIVHSAYNHRTVTFKEGIPNQNSPFCVSFTKWKSRYNRITKVYQQKDQPSVKLMSHIHSQHVVTT